MKQYQSLTLIRGLCWAVALVCGVAAVGCFGPTGSRQPTVEEEIDAESLSPRPEVQVDAATSGRDAAVDVRTADSASGDASVGDVVAREFASIATALPMPDASQDMGLREDMTTDGTLDESQPPSADLIYLWPEAESSPVTAPM